ncbi:MAG: hypothetical protein IKS88_00815 [Clostridia bacterium]|nr:hypothetical protein [Clostridia bacterium]
MRNVSLYYIGGVLHRFRKPIGVYVIEWYDKFPDLILFGRALYVFGQIVQPDLAQTHNAVVYPADRLTVAIKAIAAEHLFHSDVQGLQIIEPLGNDLLVFISSLKGLSRITAS